MALALDIEIYRHLASSIPNALSPREVDTLNAIVPVLTQIAECTWAPLEETLTEYTPRVRHLIEGCYPFPTQGATAAIERALQCNFFSLAPGLHGEESWADRLTWGSDETITYKTQTFRLRWPRVVRGGVSCWISAFRGETHHLNWAIPLHEYPAIWKITMLGLALLHRKDSSLLLIDPERGTLQARVLVPMLSRAPFCDFHITRAAFCFFAAYDLEHEIHGGRIVGGEWRSAFHCRVSWGRLRAHGESVCFEAGNGFPSISFDERGSMEIEL